MDKPMLPATLTETIAEQTAAIKAMEPVLVTNPHELAAAQSFILDVSREKKTLDDHRKAEKEFYLQGTRLVDGLFNPAIKHLEYIETETKRSVLAYQRAAEQAAREAERREQEAAEERRRALLAEAEEADEAGNHGDARWLRTDAHLQAAPVLPMVAPLAPGLSARTTWKAEVTDFMALLKAAAARPGLYAAYLTPNLQELNAVARRQGKDMQIPGVTAVPNETLTARGR